MRQLRIIREHRVPLRSEIDELLRLVIEKRPEATRVHIDTLDPGNPSDLPLHPPSPQ